MIAILFSTDGTISEVAIKCFVEAQAIVGGLVEIVYFDNENVLLLNEEGRGLELPPNPFLFFEKEIVAGNVLLAKTKDLDNIPYELKESERK